MASNVYNIYFTSYVLLCFSTSSAFGVLRPRGVPLSKKIFYDPNQKFNCLDGSTVVPFHFVNDDFCDCEDGSDEPGTSACPNGEFICCNYGHLSVTLPSSRVNDGICDCCDASDEFNSSADCLDNCKELGIASYNAAKAVFEQYSKGNETRQLFIAESKERKEELRNQLNSLLEKETEYLRLKLQKQDLKERAEEKEHIFLGIQKQIKEEQEKRHMMELKLLQEQKLQDEADAKQAFEKLDINKDNKLTLAEVQSFPGFDYDGDGKVSEKEAKFYMQKKEELTLVEFLSNGWRAMKPAFIIEEPSPIDEDSTSHFHTFSAPPKVVKSAVREIDEAEKNAVFEDGAIRRKEFADANKKLQDVQSEIWNVEKKLNLDYGPEDEFLALENKCFDFTERRYLYRLCLFDKVIQILRHNMDETLLGLWDDWNGPGNSLYSGMRYTRGSTCWNGPSRSVFVTLECGLENKILSVVETSPCVYQFILETPALCKDVPSDVENLLNTNVINL